MDISRLREIGGIVPAAPVRREVSWTRRAESGEEVTDTFTVFIRKHSCATVERISDARHDQDRSAVALILSESVRLGEDGSESLSYELALELDPQLARILVDAVNDVNGFRGDVPKN